MAILIDIATKMYVRQTGHNDMPKPAYRKGGGFMTILNEAIITFESLDETDCECNYDNFNQCSCWDRDCSCS